LRNRKFDFKFSIFQQQAKKLLHVCSPAVSVKIYSIGK